MRFYSIPNFTLKCMPFCHPNVNKHKRTCLYELVGEREMKTLSPALLIVQGLVRRCIFFGDDQMFPMQFMKASNRTFRQIFIYHLKEKYVTMHLCGSFFHLWSYNRYFSPLPHRKIL